MKTFWIKCNVLFLAAMFAAICGSGGYFLGSHNVTLAKGDKNPAGVRSAKHPEKVPGVFSAPPAGLEKPAVTKRIPTKDLGKVGEVKEELKVEETTKEEPVDPKKDPRDTGVNKFPVEKVMVRPGLPFASKRIPNQPIYGGTKKERVGR